MFLLEGLKNKMIVIYAFNITQVEKGRIFNTLLGNISNERKTKIDRFLFYDDKLRSLFSETMLRYAIYDLYAINLPQVKFSYSKFGKPYLVNNKEIHFNISHSGDWVLCGLGESPIGIDVEKITPNKCDSIIESVITADEKKYILERAIDERYSCFLRVWTLKESYVKRIGMGLNIPFDSFSFEICDEIIEFYLNNEKCDDYFFWSRKLDGEHWLSVCVDKQDAPKIDTNIRVVSLTEVMEWHYSQIVSRLNKEE